MLQNIWVFWILIGGNSFSLSLWQQGMVKKNYIWFKIPILLFTAWVTLGKSLNHSGFSFLFTKMGKMCPNLGCENQIKWRMSFKKEHTAYFFVPYFPGIWRLGVRADSPTPTKSTGVSLEQELPATSHPWVYYSLLPTRHEDLLASVPLLCHNSFLVIYLSPREKEEAGSCLRQTILRDINRSSSQPR